MLGIMSDTATVDAFIEWVRADRELATAVSVTGCDANQNDQERAMESRAVRPRKVRITSVDARKLVSECSAVADEALSRRLSGRAYVTADDHVIVLSRRSAYANVYESRDEVEAWLADVYRRAKAGPDLSTVIPSGREFGSRAPTLAEALLQDLGIASRAYEPSLLGAVEKRLRSKPREEVLLPPLLESIMALVGECIRTQVKGSTWWMREPMWAGNRSS
jgi:hypothetical protein